MKTYFDIIKLIFFLLTIIVALFELRIKGVISTNILDTVGPYILPAYFVFIGLIIGYIIGYLLDMKNDNQQEEKDYTTGFIAGVVIGIILAFIYYFFLNA